MRDVVRLMMRRDGLTQRALAAELGLNDQQLSDRLRPNWTSTRSPQPPFRPQEIVKLMDLFKVTPDELFGAKDVVIVIPSRGNNMGYSGTLVGKPVLAGHAA